MPYVYNKTEEEKELDKLMDMPILSGRDIMRSNIVFHDFLGDKKRILLDLIRSKLELNKTD